MVIYINISTYTSDHPATSLRSCHVTNFVKSNDVGNESSVGLNWSETVKKCSKDRNIFLVPLNIPELVSGEIILIRVRLPGGAAIFFAQSWNFELKFFVDNPFKEKISSMGVRSHFF